MRIRRSTIQLLRFPFSFFLLPVYLFALGQIWDKDWKKALLVFIILHILVYPASNGYNSYMDRDVTPIGGLQHPMAPTRQLFRLSILMDLAALLLGCLISRWFVGGLIIYILASRAYSYRGIRLKRYPIVGYLVVTLCQGALVFFLVYHGSHPGINLEPPPLGMLASSLLVGGFYPLTQIYQHEEDGDDGVTTLSMLLGYRGSFIFTGIVYGIAFATLAYYFLFITLQWKEFCVLATCMLPVTVYFFMWASKVWKDVRQANFANTMAMNWLAAICINAGFLIILLM
jgi:1,4-dihydroxy-2-naphthoate polyprenyltransferase